VPRMRRPPYSLLGDWADVMQRTTRALWHSDEYLLSKSGIRKTTGSATGRYGWHDERDAGSVRCYAVTERVLSANKMVPPRFRGDAREGTEARRVVRPSSGRALTEPGALACRSDYGVSDTYIHRDLLRR
jgi:hypothetical protein